MAEAVVGPVPRPLDEVMLAMDVVDTLRHREKLVAEELSRPDNDEALLQRLRQIYAAQGIVVSDRVLAEGVKALRENRFAHVAPRDVPLWIRLYVHRGLWARRALLLAVVVLAAWVAYTALVIAPLRSLEAGLARSHDAILEVSGDEAVRQRADALFQQARTAVEDGETTQARAMLTELEGLQEQLERSFELVLAAGPNSAIGVWRVPEANEAARNYYLIVEAVDDRGDLVTLPVLNEETGETERVSTFGLGVSEAAWERVATDVEEDGLIQDDVVGVKKPGELDPEYRVETTGGAITRW